MFTLFEIVFVVDTFIYIRTANALLETIIQHTFDVHFKHNILLDVLFLLRLIFQVKREEVEIVSVFVRIQLKTPLSHRYTVTLLCLF